jgi:TusA-related sulfurtransferase
VVSREPGRTNATPPAEEDPAAFFDGEDLDLASGLMFALDVSLSDIGVGEVLELSSSNPTLALELPAWCRGTGHELVGSESDGSQSLYRIRRGERGALMFRDRPDWGVTPEFRHDGFDTRDWLVGKAGAIPERADETTGFSPRGSVIESGSPPFPFTETERDHVWAQNVAALYEQATGAQWDASADIRWRELRPLPTHLERAVCQVMTHLAENEYAALYVPARFIPRIHPHYTEVVMFLSTQVVDEARHIEAFTKRALANGGGLGFSTAMTQTSLRSLLEQEDFSQASFLLSVLGEGAFLEYLAFVERFAPDPVTADIVRRARADEARHVAFGVEHARHYLGADPDRVEILRDAVERRAAYLADTSGQSAHVEEALVVLAAGGVSAGRIRDGVVEVRRLHEVMQRRRVGRLRQLGFPTPVAEEISQLHTPNFM